MGTAESFKQGAIPVQKDQTRDQAYQLDIVFSEVAASGLIRHTHTQNLHLLGYPCSQVWPCDRAPA